MAIARRHLTDYDELNSMTTQAAVSYWNILQMASHAGASDRRDDESEDGGPRTVPQTHPRAAGRDCAAWTDVEPELVPGGRWWFNSA